MIKHYALLLAVLVAGMAASVALKKLTLPAALLGGLLGMGVYAGAGFGGLALLAVFFAVATLATGYKKTKKQQIGLSSARERQRTAGQVFANGGVAGLLGTAILAMPQHAELLQVCVAGSLSAALGDTLSSELGVVFGKRFYNITTGKPDARGLDGVVSLEGSAAGVSGSALIALTYALGFGWDAAVSAILVGGMAGNAADSILGATLERNHRLSNNSVNFLNTTVGALIAGFIYFILT